MQIYIYIYLIWRSLFQNDSNLFQIRKKSANTDAFEEENLSLFFVLTIIVGVEIRFIKRGNIILVSSFIPLAPWPLTHIYIGDDVQIHIFMGMLTKYLFEKMTFIS